MKNAYIASKVEFLRNLEQARTLTIADLEREILSLSRSQDNAESAQDFELVEEIGRAIDRVEAQLERSCQCVKCRAEEQQSWDLYGDLS